MKIVKLTAENIKRLTAVEIQPGGHVVKISGKNGAGKSSVLDAMMYALAGGKHLPDKPVRAGQEKASVTLDLGDLIVTRRFTAAGGSSLYVETKEGARFPSPQAILDTLVGRLSFDPLAFTRLDDAKKVEALRELTGLDFSDIEKRRADLYAERTVVNRNTASLKARLECCPPFLDGELIDTAALDAEILAANTAAAEYRNLTQMLENEESALLRMDQDITDTTRRLIELQTRLEGLQTQREEMMQRRFGISLKIEEIKKSRDGKLTREALETERQQAVNHNRIIEDGRVTQSIRESWEAALAESHRLSEAINALDAEKELRVSQAAMPLPGLSFGDGIVTYNGLPLSQASQAEQIRVSVAIAMALNPKLRVIRITDGSLLDSESMRILDDLAREKDYQVWMEVVDESGKVGVVIDDGHVAAVNAA